MKEIAMGQTNAFNILFQRYSSAVLGYSCRILGSMEKAEDASQDIWMKLVKSASSFSGSSVKPWLMTITRNTCLNVIRSQSRFREMKSELYETKDLHFQASDIEEILSQTQDIAAAKKVIQDLPDAQRVALTLYMTENCSYEEISKELDTSVSSVKSLLFRARETLRSQLQGGAQ